MTKEDRLRAQTYLRQRATDYFEANPDASVRQTLRYLADNYGGAMRHETLTRIKTDVAWYRKIEREGQPVVVPLSYPARMQARGTRAVSRVRTAAAMGAVAVGGIATGALLGRLLAFVLGELVR